MKKNGQGGKEVKDEDFEYSKGEKKVICVGKTNKSNVVLTRHYHLIVMQIVNCKHIY